MQQVSLVMHEGRQREYSVSFIPAEKVDYCGRTKTFQDSLHRYGSGDHNFNLEFSGGWLGPFGVVTYLKTSISSCFFEEDMKTVYLLDI